jgi:hypothetical protein
MEYIVEKTQKVKKLSQEDKDSLAKKIVEDFKSYDTARSEQLQKAQKLSDEIYFKNTVKTEQGKNKSWKSKLKMCKAFMYSQILKAFIWKNVYANTNSMFDVSGENLEADNNSNKQKTMLVDCLEKMNYAKTCDEIIDKSLIYGELISFTTWKKHSEEYRRPISFFDGITDPTKLPKILEAKLKGDKFYTDERVDYDNPYIYPVDPSNFVFDTTQYDRNWETCPKINRTWRTPEDIINNKYYDVSKDVANELREMVKTGSDQGKLSNQESESLKDEHRNGTTVEMLEHWGDLMLPDGTVLRNWYAVVVAGKYLVRFEKNPFIINPFTFGAYVIDPDTKRGISPLYSILDIAHTQEDIMRRTVNLQSLTENPPVLAPKGFFGNNPDDIDMYPGKVIEYDPQLYADSAVKPIEFNPNVFVNEIDFMNDMMSEISGVFPNMAGASENDRTTATEISTKVEGQLTRLKMLLDVINQNLILADVKNIAKLKANFTFGEEMVFVNNENQPENVVIDDNIRQADYRYTYADRSATNERFNYVDMVAQAMQMFVKTGLQINIDEFFTWFMEQKGVENPERFLNVQNFLSPEVQQALMNDPTLAPIIQEMQKRVEMAKQGKALPENSDNVTQLQPMKPVEESLPEKLSHIPGRNLMNG